MQPKIGDLAKTALGFVAGIGGGLLQFLAAFIIAGIIMAFGKAGERGSVAIFERFVGPARGAEFAKLSTATIRAVARASSAWPSSRRSSSAFVCCSPAYRGPAFWR